MDFKWTAHRFSGGTLALDVANSVVLRTAADRSIDRFAEPEQLDAFAAAAMRLCAEPLPALVPPTVQDRASFLALREAIDRYFRRRVEGMDDPVLLADLLDTAARVLRAAHDESGLATSTARSALRLATRPDDGRLKICPNCGWLFLDRSKNKSRMWCDMTVCGNRRKASRHYRRTKDGGPR